MKMKYLDTNVFLYPILYEDDKAKLCKEILTKLVNNQFLGCTSVLTWDELVYVLKKKKGKEIAVKEGKKFLMFPNLIFIESSEEIILNAQELISEYNINPRDAIHIVSALHHNVNEIISDDPDFDLIKEIKRIKVEEIDEL